MRRLSALASLALLAACSASETPSEAPKQPGATHSAASASPAPAPAARKVEISNDEIEFSYSYPAQAAAIPALKSMLDSDLEEQKETIRRGALEARELAKENPGFPAYPYSHATSWLVVAEIPGWLSLSADRWEFTGGAHGNPWFDSLVWDKAANLRRKPADLFTSPAALSKAIRASFCNQIDRQRAEKRGAPVNRAGGEMFDECIDPVESTIILGSSDKQHFDRIGVLVGPYAAGPYVEGDYEATIPVTPAVLAAVKPQYRALFAVKR